MSSLQSNCYMIVEHMGSVTSTATLPCYPDEISDNQNAVWSTTSIVGRSAPISAYTSTEYRAVSFSFDMHREMTGNKNDIDNILNSIRMSVYPKYDGAGTYPPITTFVLGDFRARGIVSNYSMQWKKPIINNEYQVCSVSISMYDIPERVIAATNLSYASPANPFGHSR